jgi:flagellar biogenesis protein FliO
MPRANCPRLALACVWGSLVLTGASFTPAVPRAHADEQPPNEVALGEPDRPRAHHQFKRREPDRRAQGEPRAASGSWWLGTAGMILVIAALGGVSVASKRWRILPERNTGPLQVVGRAALSSRHSVYLLRAGDRILIVGAGTQGPPAFLGELTDPNEVRRVLRRQEPRAETSASAYEATTGEA